MTFPKSFQVGGSLPIPLTISNKTAAYTVQAIDAGTIINCTSGTFTLGITAAAALGSGFSFTVWNTSTSSSDVVTIDPAGSETIDGVTTLLLRVGEGTQVICNGTNWETGNKKTMRGYSENLTSSVTRPIASGNFSLALGRGSTASGVGSFAVNSTSLASNDYAMSIGPNTQASGAYSVALGNNSAGFAAGSQAITGSSAMALGGSYASGVDSFAAAITNNTSTYGATAANAIAMGYLQNASAQYASAIGGNANTASGIASAVLGGANGTTRSIAGNIASAASNAPIGATLGGNQLAMLILARQTTDATATVLASNSSAAAATNQITLPNNSAYYFRGEVIAGVTGAGDTKGWYIEGVIKRGANAAATSLVGTPSVTSLYADAGATTWAVAVAADTTLGCLKITVTGQAATTIRWVAQVRTTEMTY